MTLTNSDIAELTAFRRDLHRHPELSGEESETARRVLAALVPLAPDRVLSGLGGHGIAAVFEGAAPGRPFSFAPSSMRSRSRSVPMRRTARRCRARVICAAMTGTARS